MTMTKQPITDAINVGKDSLSSLAENFIKDKDMRGNT
jgi:hypothetical protein